ncbi:ABC transporter substrate-binding protein [Pantoea ananatis]|uniref:ABC transporter substrate-binding protein n=1 Tax=Pantoea ananas TaxID=553 RepID=UPI003FA40697
MMKLASVACMDQNKSVHTKTWLRAIELAREFVLPAQVTLKLFDDNADAQGAAEAARQIVEWKPDAIVGHFSSAAAEAAAPLYAQHNMPLFLPAATAKHLTSSATTWRLCDNDEDYVNWLLPLLMQEGEDTLAIEHDGSIHGKSVAHQLNTRIKMAEKSGQSATTFFAGNFRSALDRALNWASDSADGARLILSDDAFSNELVPSLLASDFDLYSHKIFVAAIAPQPTGETASKLITTWQERWGGMPGCYFWETLAALQVACQYPDFPANTLLGPLSFNTHRESKPNSFSLWQATSHGLKCVLTPEVRL